MRNVSIRIDRLHFGCSCWSIIAARLAASASPILFRPAPHGRSRRVLELEPVRRAAGPVARPQALRHDPLHAQLAGVVEYDVFLRVLKVVVKTYSVTYCATIWMRTLTLIVAQHRDVPCAECWPAWPCEPQSAPGADRCRRVRAGRRRTGRRLPRCGAGPARQTGRARAHHSRLPLRRSGMTAP